MAFCRASSTDRDGGFTVIEVGIAAMLLSVFVVALATSLNSASNNVVDNRARAQAMAILTEEMEFMRSLTLDELAMVSVDPDAPMLNPAATALLGDEAGLEEDEVLHTSAAGLVIASGLHTSENVEYTAWRYVTDAGDSLLRAVVRVEWNIEGRERSLQSTTLVSEFTAGPSG